ncbi:hypothetical protein [Nannocystis sp. SCPEA4]|uniref:hypothetical protein n=1 Tax=Nannocystis sp. SCPEA4 TaxID=2996787 RepID=UPI00226E2923|nr:hypothetical protein [Nannocystis sp. SCPEA4]MCY1055649.1 hypothetical protein [Nannocystis sp. SCPEA4]
MSRHFYNLMKLVAVAGLAGACDFEEALEGEPCTVEDDCWHTQECSRTGPERFYKLPGICQPEGTGCVFGRQLGCACNPIDPATNCTVPALPFNLHATYPRLVCDAAILQCAVAPPEGGDQP